MKKSMTIFIITVLAACESLFLHAQVGVNILTPHASAALQVESPQGTYRGMLTPSVTTSNRMSISSGTAQPADGLVVYDVNHRMHYYYHAGQNKWVSLSPFTLSTPTVGSASIPYGAITTPFAPTIYSVGINRQTPSQALDVVGNVTVTGNISTGSSVNAGSLSVNGFGTNALVPPGTIVMWSGNAIPAGWAECNGTSGTPDLRGRFIVAAGQAPSTTIPGDYNPSYVVNTTGGENHHILSKAEIPRHYHNASGDGATMAASGGSHGHQVTPNGQGTNASRAGGNAGGLASDGSATINTTNNTHSHPNSEFTGRVGDGATDGLNNQGHENRPQYYVLRFIMKL
jgi:microcystin-dependent protein